MNRPFAGDLLIMKTTSLSNKAQSSTDMSKSEHVFAQNTYDFFFRFSSIMDIK